jgi:four helix bundle protein
VIFNIAEGNGRFSKADYLRHLSMSSGSLNESQAQIILARDCGYLQTGPARHAMQLAAETGRLLMALAESLRKSSHR